jgi:hypothetical protein
VQTGDKLEFRFDIKNSTEHALLYGRQYIPGRKVYFTACFVPVLLTVVGLIYLATKYMPRLEFVSRELRPLTAGLGFGAIAYLVIKVLQKVWMPIIKSWLYNQIESKFPAETVVVEKLNDELTISVGGVVTKLPLAEIHALSKSAKGLIVGIRTSAFFIPNDAAGGVENMGKFANSLKLGMSAGAIARSSGF